MNKIKFSLIIALIVSLISPNVPAVIGSSEEAASTIEASKSLREIENVRVTTRRPVQTTRAPVQTTRATTRSPNPPPPVQTFPTTSIPTTWPSLNNTSIANYDNTTVYEDFTTIRRPGNSGCRLKIHHTNTFIVLLILVKFI